MTIKAIFERGMFRPTEPVQLQEGTVVEVVVSMAGTTGETDAAKLTARLAEISTIPLDGPEPQDGCSASRDHDQILYGGPKGAA